MKKITVLSFALLLAFGVSAQKYGVKVGGTMSGYLINFYSPAGSSMSKGLNVDLLADIPLTGDLSIAAFAGLNQMGSDYDSRNEADADWPARPLYEYDYKQSVNYLRLGVGPKYSFGPAFVTVAPYLAYALSANQTTKIDMVTGDDQVWTVNMFDEPSTSFDPLKPFSNDNNAGGTGDLLNKLDVGVNLGIGVSIMGVIVEADAGYGFMNYINTGSSKYAKTNYAMASDKTKPLTDDASQKNVYFGLSVGYMLGAN